MSMEHVSTHNDVIESFKKSLDMPCGVYHLVLNIVIMPQKEVITKTCHGALIRTSAVMLRYTHIMTLDITRTRAKFFDPYIFVYSNTILLMVMRMKLIPKSKTT